jgi:crossover junction endodeoxyribonuclease RuvC
LIKIIGVDPGLAATGIGIVRGAGLKVSSCSYGSIYTSAASPLPDRLDLLYSRLLDTLYAESPDLMIMEEAFSLSKQPKSGITLGQVTGVLSLASSRAGVPVALIAVREAKRVLTGSGSASKAQLEKAVRHALGLTEPIRPYHASDAVAFALIGMYRYAHARTSEGESRGRDGARG